MVVEFHLGDALTLRKAHPCGGKAWRVERLGADIGIRCLTCGHYLLTSRRKLERAVKEHAHPAVASDGPTTPGGGAAPEGP